MTDSFLLYGYPWLLIAVLAAWAALIWTNFKTIRSLFSPLITPRGWAAAALIFLAALCLRLVVFPPRHQVYFDEFAHQDAAENISRSHTFGETLAGGLDVPPLLQPPASPGGFHVLLGTLFKLTGPSETAAFRFNAVLASLSVLVLFLLAALLFNDQLTGLACALLLAGLPLHIRFSGTADLSPCSTLWVLIALLALALYQKAEKLPMYLLLLASLAYSVNVRFENLVLVLCAAFVLARLWRRSGSVRQDGYLITSCAFAGPLIPAVALALRNRGHGLYGYADPWPGLFHNLVRNLPSNLAYLLSSWAYVLVLAPAIAIGWLKAEKTVRPWMTELLALGLGYLVVCSAHAGGDFNDSATERLALPTVLALILAAGGGFKVIMSRARSRASGAAWISGAFVMCSLPYYGKLPREHYEAEYRLVADSAASLPQDAYVLAYCPPLIRVGARKPAASPVLALLGGEGFLDDLDGKGARPLILFKDVWWYKYADASGKLERMLRSRYRSEPLKTANIDGDEYGFHLLTRRQTIP
ncbi:MAG: glycosyltransferase family 39 protein [Elusimicrobia bacterium]|nr:glycosyltransferase family 39 protein [Elusimicrobiota bacterium]